jgi:hypothetical protein
VPHLGPQGIREGDSESISNRMETALTYPQKTIAAGRLQERNKMGRLQGRSRPASASDGSV